MKTLIAPSWLVALLALCPEVVVVVSAVVKAPTGRYSWQQHAQRRNQDKDKSTTKKSKKSLLDKSTTKKSKKSLKSKTKSSTIELPVPECTGEEGPLAFDFVTDDNLRECRLFASLAPPLGEEGMQDQSLLELTAWTSFRDYCPCLQGDEAVAWCEAPGIDPEGSDPDYYYYAAPECRQETGPTLVDTNVCGSAYITASLDIYRQYCVTEVDSVYAAVATHYTNYLSALSMYTTRLDDEADEITPATSREALRDLARMAYVDVLDAYEKDIEARGESVDCLEGCAQFVASNCCDDEEFVQRSECPLLETMETGLSSANYTLVTAGQPVSSCSPNKEFPSFFVVEEGEEILYQRVGGYSSFSNPFPGSHCYTVRLVIVPESCPPDSILAAAYLVPFDLNNPEMNYLGDSGRVVQPITDFSFTLGAFETFELVVMEARPEASLCDYRFTVWREEDCAVDFEVPDVQT